MTVNRIHRMNGAMNRISSSYTIVFFYLVAMGTGTINVVSALPTPFDVLTSLRSGAKFLDRGQQELSHGHSPKYCPRDPDGCRNVVELISSKGYPVEQHSVMTADGFILSLQRIPHGKNSSQLQPADGSPPTSRPAVFLQHGIADTAATWIMNMAEQSLSTILADAGFDVWLGNVRGNTYSVRHASLNSTNPDFWKWSWDEMQKFDLPAMINYVLNATGQQQLDYVGHSQGSLIAFAGFSANQELARKVKKLVALAPVAVVGNVRGVARLFAETFSNEQLIEDMFGTNEFLTNTDANRLVASAVCSHHPLGSYLCQEAAFLAAGRHFFECNVTRFQVIFSQLPAGTSVRNAKHYCQMFHNKKMTWFDYGSPELNEAHYNQTTPPEYDPSKMMVPAYLFSGSNDLLAAPEDVQWIASRLPQLVRHEVMPGWNHMDFVWGTNAAPALFRQIASILRE